MVETSQGDVVIPLSPPHANPDRLYMKYVVRQYADLKIVEEDLRVNCRRISSIEFDMTRIPNVYDAAKPAHGIKLLYSSVRPSTEASEPEPSFTAQPPPDLSQLEDLRISTSRMVSIRDLLMFLHCCPNVKNISIHNSRAQTSVYPEDVDGIPQPRLPNLQRVALDGLREPVVEHFLSKIGKSLTGNTKLAIDLYDSTVPSLEYVPALQKVLRPIHHARISYRCLGPERAPCSSMSASRAMPSGDGLGYELSFADVSERVRLTWRWYLNNDPKVKKTSPRLQLIDLACPTFSSVHELELKLENVQPPVYDLRVLFQAFTHLQRLVVISSHRTDTPASTSSPPQQPFPNHAIFTLRRGRLWDALHRVTNIPTLFILKVADVVPTPPNVLPEVTLKRTTFAGWLEWLTMPLYGWLWKRMVQVACEPDRSES